MNKSDPQDMTLEALEALQKDLACASGDVRKELALIASVIDQKRAEEKKEQESETQEIAQRSEQTESTQPDSTVTPKVAEPASDNVTDGDQSKKLTINGVESKQWIKNLLLPFKKAERESTPRGARVPTIEVQDKWGGHKPFSEQVSETWTKAFFYFVVLGPGLIVFLLMAALFYYFPLFSN